MGILQKIFSPFKKALDLPLLSRWSSSVTSVFGTRRSSLYTGWVYLAVSCIKDEIANIKLVLQKMDADGNVTVIHKHPVITLLAYVNEFFTQYELFERLQADLELYGNHYWVLEKNKQGIPIAIFPVMSSCMKAIIDPHNYVSGYQYSMDGVIYTIPKEDVVHFKNYNPESFIEGLSTIEAVRVAVTTDEEAKRYNEAFYKNNAVPSVVLEYPNSLPQDVINTMRKQWENSFSGFKNAYRTAIASGGLKVNVVDVKHADMQYIEQRRFTRDEILAIFKVPPTVAGINEATVYASAKASYYSFSKGNIEPKMRKIVNTLNEFLLWMYNEEGLQFTFISPVPQDITEKTAYYQSGINNGYLTLNEVRTMEGLPLLEQGDDVFLPFSLSPYSRPVQKQVVYKPSTREIAESTAKALAPLLLKTEEEKELYGGQWTPEQFDTLGEGKAKTRNSRMRSYEKQFFNTSQKLFEDQKNRIIKELEKGKKSTKKLVAPDVFDEEEEIGVTIDLFSPLFKEVTEKEGKEALLFLGLDPDDFTINTPSMQAFIKKNVKKFAGEITMKTSQDIRAQLIAGLEQGEAIAELTKRIENYSGFDKARSEMISRTEVMRSSGEAEVEAWKASGVVEYKVWYTALDERVCPDCDSMHGTEVPVDKPFLNEQDQLDMGLEPYTAEINGATLHPNCRCTMLPVVAK